MAACSGLPEDELELDPAGLGPLARSVCRVWNAVRAELVLPLLKAVPRAAKSEAIGLLAELLPVLEDVPLAA
jgi:hypothetical protein